MHAHLYPFTLPVVFYVDLRKLNFEIQISKRYENMILIKSLIDTERKNFFQQTSLTYT